MRKVPIDNPRYPHQIKIVRRIERDWLDVPSDGSTSEEDEELVVYEGPGRSYTDTTTVGDTKVDSNKRKASIPMRFDDWKPVPSGDGSTSADEETKPLIPMSGDILYVTKGYITEQWEVRDFEPDNDRSVVYGEMNRNFNIE